MAKLSPELKPKDRVSVSILRVICSDCGQAVPDETIERLTDEEEITFNCTACGNSITLNLWSALYVMASENSRDKEIIKAQLTGDTWRYRVIMALDKILRGLGFLEH